MKDMGSSDASSMLAPEPKPRCVSGQGRWVSELVWLLGLVTMDGPEIGCTEEMAGVGDQVVLLL